MVRPPISRLNIKKRRIFNFDYIHRVYLDSIRRNLILKSFRYAMLLKSDKEVILAVQQNGLALKYVAKELRSVKEVVLAAVTQNGLALKYVPKELRSDKEVALAAIQEDGSALEFASKELKEDSDIVLAAVKNDNLALNFASKECILYIIQNKYNDLSNCQEGCILENLSPKLKKYRDITLAAILNFDIELSYALPKFRNDKKFILTIAKKNKLNLECVSKKLRDDEEIVLAAIKQDAIINNVYALGPAVFLTSASSRLQRDKKFLMKCYRANKITKYFSNIIKKFDKMSKYFYE